MTLRKLVLSAAAAIAASLTLNAGAPPTVMFLPDKTWCNANDYVDRSERNGKTRITEKYDEAFLNSDLKNVVVQLNALMRDNGLPAKEYGTSSELDDEEEMEEDAYGNDSQSGVKHKGRSRRLVK